MISLRLNSLFASDGRCVELAPGIPVFVHGEAKANDIAILASTAALVRTSL